MKKIIALVLLVLLAFSLSACGSDDQNNDTIFTSEANGGMYADHPLLQGLYGQWAYRGDYMDSYPFSEIEVNQDGTCTVDGQTGTWKISDQTSDETLYIDVLLGAETIDTVAIYAWDEQFKFTFPHLPMNPGDRWVNLAAEEAAINELLAQWGDVLFGQWEVFSRDDVSKIDSIIICDDGIAKIGDRTFHWQLGEDWMYFHNEFDIVVLDGDVTLYDMKIWWEDGDLHGQLNDPNDDYIILYKPSYYEILEITVDNIHEYFEMVTSWEETRNGFDELEQVDTMSDFILKEPYASRVSYINSDSWDYNVVDSGTIEWRFQIGSFDVLLNEDHTFTLENCVSKWEKTEIYSGYGSEQSYYHFTVPYTFDWYKPGENLDVEQWRAHNDNGYFGFEVVRVKLTLYLIPE